MGVLFTYYIQINRYVRFTNNNLYSNNCYSIPFEITQQCLKAMKNLNTKDCLGNPFKNLTVVNNFVKPKNVCKMQTSFIKNQITC